MAIPWETIGREARDAGCYMVLMRLPRGARATVGSLGRLTLPEGYYLYVGSAGRSLTKRMERHIRKGGAVHRHIDCLKPYADRCDD
ncbi:MAG: DUF123 domain-containing protein [Thermodesulfobacteriota bacterium]